MLVFISKATVKLRVFFSYCWGFLELQFNAKITHEKKKISLKSTIQKVTGAVIYSRDFRPQKS